MSHPETMPNVLRYCIKLLRQQQSREFLLKEVHETQHRLPVHPPSSPCGS